MELRREPNAWAARSELALSEFERALHHLLEAFDRWSVDLHTYVDGTLLHGKDVAVLHVIGLKDRAKSAVDIAKFLNRADSANVLYGLRKLERVGLVEKIGGTRRQVVYQLTRRGRDVTDRYAAVRRDVLLTRLSALSDPTQMLEALTERVWSMAGFYEQAVRDLSVMSGLPSDGPRPQAEKLAASKKPAFRRPSAKPKKSRR
jgi:predicted MarR family transcription regulator